MAPGTMPCIRGTQCFPSCRKPTTAIGRAPSNILIQNIESYVDKHDQPLVRLIVQLRDFSEAQRFFQCLPKNRASIEDYGREEEPRRL